MNKMHNWKNTWSRKLKKKKKTKLHYLDPYKNIQSIFKSQNEINRIRYIVKNL